MALPSEVLEHGTFSGGVVNEPTLSPVILVDSLTMNFTREEERRRNMNGTTTYVKYTDPTAELQLTGKISNDSGLANQEAGSSISSLANFSSTLHGIDPSEGTIIYKDPSRELSAENDFATLSFTSLYLPFVS